MAAIPTDPQSLDAVAKWPLTVVLGFVCCFCVWLMYKQAKDFSATATAASRAAADAQMAMAKSILDLVGEIKQRPCVRNPAND